MKKQIVFVLLDEFADWEGAFLAPALTTGVLPIPSTDSPYTVKYLTPDGSPVRSIGGMQVIPDYDASALPAESAGLILIGGLQWQSPAAGRIAPLVEEALTRGIPVGGICNASLFLGAHGFLNGIQHTGNTVEMLKKWGGARYTGEKLYEERQAVRDGNIITANGSGFLEFTRECLLAIGAATAEQVAAWYAFNKSGFYKQ